LVGRRTSWLAVGLAAACPLLALAGLARANGGDTVASAPEAPLGVEVSIDREAGSTAVDYWRVTLARNDLLTVDFRKTSQEFGYTLVAAVWDLGTSDFGIGQDEGPVAERSTRTKGKLTFRAGQSGRWLLSFYNGCFLCVELPLRSAFTAHVRYFTRVVLTGPSIARPGQALSLRGKVIGRAVAGGKVFLQVGTGPRAQRPVAANGSFSYATRAGAPGVYRVRAFYGGDARHQASSATVRLRVT
jgi:hypothetical protein